jgi:hypothetical protein
MIANIETLEQFVNRNIDSLTNKYKINKQDIVIENYKSQLLNRVAIHVKIGSGRSKIFSFLQGMSIINRFDRLSEMESTLSEFRKSDYYKGSTTELFDKLELLLSERNNNE